MTPAEGRRDEVNEREIERESVCVRERREERRTATGPLYTTSRGSIDLEQLRPVPKGVATD